MLESRERLVWTLFCLRKYNADIPAKIFFVIIFGFVFPFKKFAH